MQPFNATPNNPAINTLHDYSFPVDNVDRASVTTVNPTAAKLANDIHFMMRAGSSLRPHIGLRSANGADVQIYAHGFTYAYNGTKWIPQLKGTSSTYVPAGIMPNTWYYMYMATNNVNISDPPYEHSATPPELTLTYKTGDQTRRYMGSFLTNAVGAIIPFMMSDFDYTFGYPLDTNFSAAAFTGPGPLDVTFNNSPVAKTIKVVVKSTGNVAGTTFWVLGPKDVPLLTTTNWTGYNTPPLLIDIFTSHEFPLYATQRLVIQQVAPIAAAASIKIFWNGYKE